MEKAIIIFCFVFGMACSQKEMEESNSKEGNHEKMKNKPESLVYCGNIDTNQNSLKLKSVIVHWMYMDDSLKNLCRPLNFVLPLMESDIKTLPTFPSIEISRFQMFKEFELERLDSGTVLKNTHYFAKIVKLGNCSCTFIRYYYGDPSQSNFEGYTISEQVYCNNIGEKMINMDMYQENYVRPLVAPQEPEDF